MSLTPSVTDRLVIVVSEVASGLSTQLCTHAPEPSLAVLCTPTDIQTAATEVKTYQETTQDSIITDEPIQKYTVPAGGNPKLVFF